MTLPRTGLIEFGAPISLVSMTKKPVTNFTNGEVTIVWQPELCKHSGNCVRGLPSVFSPKEQPWIKPYAAKSSALIAQVGQCPSGALSYFENNPGV